MTLHLTTEAMAHWAAEKWLSYQDPAMREERKGRILEVTTYNLLATAFNASTVLLTAAVAAAILCSAHAAIVLGAAGLLARLISERALYDYTIPQEGANAGSIFLRMIGRSERRETLEAIQKRTEVELARDWVEDKVRIADYALWKNCIPVPSPEGW